METHLLVSHIEQKKTLKKTQSALWRSLALFTIPITVSRQQRLQPVHTVCAPPPVLRRDEGSVCVHFVDRTCEWDFHVSIFRVAPLGPFRRPWEVRRQRKLWRPRHFLYGWESRGGRWCVCVRARSACMWNPLVENSGPQLALFRWFYQTPKYTDCPGSNALWKRKIQNSNSVVIWLILCISVVADTRCQNLLCSPWCDSVHPLRNDLALHFNRSECIVFGFRAKPASISCVAILFCFSFFALIFGPTVQACAKHWWSHTRVASKCCWL